MSKMNDLIIKIKRKIGLTQRRAIYGYIFILPFILGFILFMVKPLYQSFRMSVSEVVISNQGFVLNWNNWANYIRALTIDPEFNRMVVNSVAQMFYRSLATIVFSFFVALILNQKFKGRTLARAIFFLPVIIATGPVIDIINGNMSTGGYAGGSEQFSSMFEANLVDELLNFLGVYNISDSLTEIISSVVSDIMNLVWNSGIQILLFLSALQGIPTSAKEAANMEGATAWEYFWKITIPYISPMILASIVYTVVDSFVDPSNDVMLLVLTKSSSWEHGMMAAMAWSYFAIVGVVLGIVVVIVNKVVYYEVE